MNPLYANHTNEQLYAEVRKQCRCNRREVKQIVIIMENEHLAARQAFMRWLERRQERGWMRFKAELFKIIAAIACRTRYHIRGI